MLVWPFDLIVASEDATFSDPVTAFGVNGVEYFAHAFELPMRRAKEILFTGEAVGAEEAHRIGMVNHVVPRDRLETATLELAGRIAQRPPFGLQLAKTSVNRSQDAQGFQQALDNAFALHALSHANCLARYGMLMDPSGAQIIRDMSRNADQTAH
jgi:enoyl-CoA hydratase